MSAVSTSLFAIPGGFGQRLGKSSPFALPFTREQLVFVLGLAALFLVGQLVTGTSVEVASLFGVAVLFGMLAVFAGGGLRSAFGCLNAVLVGKFLLIGITIKMLVLEPADGTLKAPLTTASVMAIGFLGLFLGTLVQSRIACPEYFSMNRPISDRMLLSFSIALFCGSYLSYFAEIIATGGGDGIQTGGWLGIARAMASLRSFAIVPPMLYLWRMRTRLWMTHPAILAVLVWSAGVGVFSTSKQEAIEPLAFYVLVGFMRYGMRNIRLWGLVFTGLLYYSVIVFPYSQYVRHNGGREGTLEQRAAITKDIFLRILNDSTFRAETTQHATANSYFDKPALTPFNRLAMVGEADRLIAGTEHQKAFTEWETITWGFKLLTPSFLSPDKPVFEAGNYLGHIVDDVGPADETTQISYGVMANFYNAFGLPGVFLGTTLLFAGFYYWIRIFLGDARWTGRPTTSALWFIWIVATFQHSIVESTVSGLIASLSFPVILGILYIASKWMSPFLLEHMVTA
jgi:hypothetical protein